MDKIPINETHRFLRWQPEITDCAAWSGYLVAKQVSHMVVKSELTNKYSIYKHMEAGRLHSRPCCKEMDATLSHFEVGK